VASTLHQCLKYYHGGEKKINGDVKPFTKAELQFANPKYFEEGTALKETIPSIISSTGSKPKTAHNSKVMPWHDGVKQQEDYRVNVEEEIITRPVGSYVTNLKICSQSSSQGRGNTLQWDHTWKYWGQGYQEG